MAAGQTIGTPITIFSGAISAFKHFLKLCSCVEQDNTGSYKDFLQILIDYDKTIKYTYVEHYDDYVLGAVISPL